RFPAIWNGGKGWVHVESTCAESGRAEATPSPIDSASVVRLVMSVANGGGGAGCGRECWYGVRHVRCWLLLASVRIGRPIELETVAGTVINAADEHAAINQALVAATRNPWIARASESSAIRRARFPLSGR